MTHVNKKKKKKKNSAVNITEKVKEELRKEKKKEQRDREVRQRDSEPLSPDADVTPSLSSVITPTRRDARLSPNTAVPTLTSARHHHASPQLLPPPVARAFTLFVNQLF